MHFIAQLAVALVAIAHVGFLVLEMFLWQRPIGRRIFSITPEFAKQSSTLAANQGLYNGFLAAGLTWSLVPLGAAGSAASIASFFLICVLIAGIYGAITVNKRILLVQAAPAVIALILVWWL